MSKGITENSSLPKASSKSNDAMNLLDLIFFLLYTLKKVTPVSNRDDPHFVVYLADKSSL